MGNVSSLLFGCRDIADFEMCLSSVTLQVLRCVCLLSLYYLGAETLQVLRCVCLLSHCRYWDVFVFSLFITWVQRYCWCWDVFVASFHWSICPTQSMTMKASSAACLGVSTKHRWGLLHTSSAYLFYVKCDAMNTSCTKCIGVCVQGEAMKEFLCKLPRCFWCYIFSLQASYILWLLCLLCKLPW